MPFLILDVDHSLASVGGLELAGKYSGIKPIQITNGLLEVKDVVSKLFVKEHIDYQHPLLSEKELFDWAKLERMYNQFISFLVQLPVWVTVNSHIQYDKNDLGQFLFHPAVKGSTKDSMLEYFDCILYTKVNNSNNRIQYLWQTRPDTQRYAKDRLDVLDPVMLQDFSILLSRYKEKGIANPKVLVIGESGSGKSRALMTANRSDNKGNGKATGKLIAGFSRG
jgi:hypothetical protein